jgi:predicted Na+-dependent transporter
MVIYTKVEYEVSVMTEDGIFIVPIILLICTGFVGGVALGRYLGVDSVQHEATKYCGAKYNEKTSDFEWIKCP